MQTNTNERLKLEAGTVVAGRWTLLQPAGRGLASVVWQGRTIADGSLVALKFFANALVQNHEAMAELQAALKKVSHVRHPAIVVPRELVMEGGRAAVMAPWIEGKSLEEMRDPKTTCSLADVARWLTGLGGALQSAHEKQAVHGALKPANIFVDGAGGVYLADLGVACWMADAQQRAGYAGSVSGSTAYWSPAQMMGRTVVEADDIYALGAVLYDLFTGRPPFYAGNISLQIAQKAPPPIAVRRAELGTAGSPVPPSWENVIMACLAKEAAQRPASIAEVLAQLGLTPASAPDASPLPLLRAGDDKVPSVNLRLAPLPPSPTKPDAPEHDDLSASQTLLRHNLPLPTAVPSSSPMPAVEGKLAEQIPTLPVVPEKQSEPVLAEAPAVPEKPSEPSPTALITEPPPMESVMESLPSFLPIEPAPIPIAEPREVTLTHRPIKSRVSLQALYRRPTQAPIPVVAENPVEEVIAPVVPAVMPEPLEESIVAVEDAVAPEVTEPVVEKIIPATEPEAVADPVLPEPVANETEAISPEPEKPSAPPAPPPPNTVDSVSTYAFRSKPKTNPKIWVGVAAGILILVLGWWWNSSRQEVASNLAGLEASIIAQPLTATDARLADFSTHLTADALAFKPAEQERLNKLWQVRQAAILEMRAKVQAETLANLRGTALLLVQPEGAEVVVDDGVPAKAPATVNNLTIGRHTYAVRAPGYELQQGEVMIKGNDTISTRITLVRTKGKLTLDSVPADAPWELHGMDGNDFSRRGSVARTIELPVGRYQVKFTRPGHNPIEQILNVEAGVNADFTADFPEGTLAVQTTNEASTVFITVDGVSRGQTPNKINLSVGAHTVEAEFNDGTKESRRVLIEKNQPASLVFRSKTEAKASAQAAQSSEAGKNGSAAAVDYEAIFTLAQVTKQPTARSQTSPKMPEEFRRRSEDGVVQVELVVDREGKVTAAKVITSSHHVLDDPTLEAVRTWRFKPAEKDGHKVSVRVVIPVSYKVN